MQHISWCWTNRVHSFSILVTDNNTEGRWLKLHVFLLMRKITDGDSISNHIPINMWDPIQKCFCYGQGWLLQPELGWNVYMSDLTSQLHFSKEGSMFILCKTDLDGLVRVWPNASSLEASRSARIIGPSFQQNGSYCAKPSQIRFGSGWLCQVLAKQIQPGSKPVCKNHLACFWADPNWMWIEIWHVYWGYSWIKNFKHTDPAECLRLCMLRMCSDLKNLWQMSHSNLRSVTWTDLPCTFRADLELKPWNKSIITMINKGKKRVFIRPVFF